MRKRAEPLDGVPKSRCCTRETGEGEGDSFVILRDRRFERNGSWYEQDRRLYSWMAAAVVVGAEFDGFAC